MNNVNMNLKTVLEVGLFYPDYIMMKRVLSYNDVTYDGDYDEGFKCSSSNAVLGAIEKGFLMCPREERRGIVEDAAYYLGDKDSYTDEDASEFLSELRSKLKRKLRGKDREIWFFSPD